MSMNKHIEDISRIVILHPTLSLKETPEIWKAESGNGKWQRPIIVLKILAFMAHYPPATFEIKM